MVNSNFLNPNFLTRFAPSPTGYLHIGNIRTALMCFLYARKTGGKFMLRIDDTDVERSKQEYIDAISRDLKWLGLEWDLTAKQSERFPRYHEVIELFKTQGRLYACYETQEELDIKRKIQLNRGLPPIYDRASLKLTDSDKQKLEAEGKKPHWRFKLDDKDSVWVDEIRGEIKFAAKHSSDPILIRENGQFTYMLPSTVDDVDFKVSHVLRGEDHISNTAIQMQIFEAMGAPIPKFAHSSLIKTKEGKLSKREGTGAVQDLREQGVSPMALCSFLAKVGTSEQINLYANLQELVASFDINKFSKAPTFYTIEDLMRLNTQQLHEADFATVREKLPADVTENFWLAVRANIKSFEEVNDWWNICNKPITPIIDDADKEFLEQAANTLPQGAFDATTWGTWTNSVKEKTGRKGKDLFMPIRKALTAQEHGPELKDLLPLIGYEKAFQRLGAFVC
jgi:glutamyl-tRNA synthetase